MNYSKITELWEDADNPKQINPNKKNFKKRYKKKSEVDNFRSSKKESEEVKKLEEFKIEVKKLKEDYDKMVENTKKQNNDLINLLKDVVSKEIKEQMNNIENMYNNKNNSDKKYNGKIEHFITPECFMDKFKYFLCRYKTIIIIILFLIFIFTSFFLVKILLTDKVKINTRRLEGSESISEVIDGSNKLINNNKLFKNYILVPQELYLGGVPSN